MLSVKTSCYDLKVLKNKDTAFYLKFTSFSNMKDINYLKINTTILKKIIG